MTEDEHQDRQPANKGEAERPAMSKARQLHFTFAFAAASGLFRLGVSQIGHQPRPAAVDEQ